MCLSTCVRVCVYVHVCVRARAAAQSDVDEAIRLMRESKRSLYEEADPAQRAHDPTSAIYELAKQLALAGAAGGGREGAAAGVVRVATSLVQ